MPQSTSDIRNAYDAADFSFSWVIAFMTMWMNGFMVFVFILFAVGIASLMSDASNFPFTQTIDVLSRLFFFLIVMIGCLAVKNSGSREKHDRVLEQYAASKESSPPPTDSSD